MQDLARNKFSWQFFTSVKKWATRNFFRFKIWLATNFRGICREVKIWKVHRNPSWRWWTESHRHMIRRGAHFLMRTHIFGRPRIRSSPDCFLTSHLWHKVLVGPWNNTLDYRCPLPSLQIRARDFINAEVDRHCNVSSSLHGRTSYNHHRQRWYIHHHRILGRRSFGRRGGS